MSSGMMANQIMRGGGAMGETFADPFLDVSSLAVPSTMRNALYWAEYIWQLFGTYSNAMERVAAFFLTEIMVEDAPEDEKEKWIDNIENVWGLLSVLQLVLLDRMAYGNAFFSIMVPFKRMLSCKNPKCRAQWDLDEVMDNQIFGCSWSIPTWTATCPRCHKRGEFDVDDWQDNRPDKIVFKRWKVHEIEILHEAFSEKVVYLWRIPEDYKTQIRRGNLHHLRSCPMEVIEAIHKNQHFRFEDDFIYHMKEPTLCGILNRGWGIPRIIRNFRQIWYVQVLRRYNEAIALDYVIPFRVVTPAQRGQSGMAGMQGTSMEPLYYMHGADVRGQLSNMIRRRRRDPASWHVLPFPVEYQILGGDANKLAPRDLHDQGYEMLLNDAGVPVDLYKGTLQLQNTPAALRLFQSHWGHLYHDINACLRWAAKTIGHVLSWEVVQLVMKPTTIADDIQKQTAALQLMMAQQLSGSSGLGALGYSWPNEQRLLAEESRQKAEIQAKVQREMEQAGFAEQIQQGMVPGQQQPQQQGGGGQPMGGPQQGPSVAGAMGTSYAGPVTQYLQTLSPDVPISPQDLDATADSLSDQLLTSPESVKDSELRRLKQSKPQLHAIVRQRMDEKRRNIRMQAGNAAMGQMQSGG